MRFLVLVFGGALLASFGLGNYASSRSDLTEVAIKVGKKDFHYAEIFKEYRQLESAYRKKTGENYEQIKHFLNLPDILQNQIINTTLIEEYYSKESFAFSPKLVKAKLESIPFFATTGLNKDSYDSFLRLNGMSANELEYLIGKEALSDVFQSSITNLVGLSKKEIQQQKIKEDTKFKFRYAVIDSSTIKYETPIREEELKAYYQKHAEEYPSNPAVKFVAVPFESQNFLSKVEFSDQDLESVYNDNKEKFFVPQQYRISRIVIDKGGDGEPKKLAEETLKRITEKNEDFALVARDVSSERGTAEMGGEVGWIKVSDLDKKSQEALSEIQKEQVSELVEGDANFKIYKLLEIKNEYYKDFKEVKEELANMYKNELAPEYAKNTATDELKSLEKSEKPLLEYAQGKNLELINSEKLIESDLSNTKPGLVKSLLTFTKGTKELVDVGGVTYLFEIQDLKEKSLKSFEEVKDLISVEIVKNKIADLARTQAETLLGELKKDPNYKNAALNFMETEEVTSKSTDELVRIGGKSIFNLMPNQFFDKVLVSKNKYFIVELKDKIVPILSTVLDDTTTAKATTFIDESLLEYLKRKENIWINPDFDLKLGGA